MRRATPAALLLVVIRMIWMVTNLVTNGIRRAKSEIFFGVLCDNNPKIDLEPYVWDKSNSQEVGKGVERCTQFKLHKMAQMVEWKIPKYISVCLIFFVLA